jgi:hypothetical protein
MECNPQAVHIVVTPARKLQSKGKNAASEHLWIDENQPDQSDRLEQSDRPEQSDQSGQSDRSDPKKLCLSGFAVFFDQTLKRHWLLFGALSGSIDFIERRHPG